MIETPTDPVQELIDKASFWTRRIGLNLMDETVIVSAGMKYPENEIVTTRIFYEYLENDPENSPEWIARQLSLLRRSIQRRFAPWLVSRKLRQIGKSLSRRV